MSFAASEVDSRASILANDKDSRRWPWTERQKWINDGIGEILIRRPAAGAVTGMVTLQAGSYQNLAATSLSLFRVLGNVKDGGRGTAIIATSMEELDNVYPDWQLSKQASVIREYMFTELEPKAFYCWPPAKAGTQVYVLHVPIPTPVTATTSLIALDNLYIGPLTFYVVSCMLAKDSEYGNGVIANMFRNAFNESLGAQNQSTAATSPNAQGAK